jgi:hypothetical protein
MRAFVLAVSLLAFSATAALADDAMASLYGNTVIAKGGLADTHSYYTADHSFTMKAPAFNMEWKGTWKVEGTQLCRTFDKAPPRVSNPLCTPLAAHKIGDTWTVAGRTVTLVQGIQ